MTLRDKLSKVFNEVGRPAGIALVCTGLVAIAATAPITGGACVFGGLGLLLKDYK